MSTAVDALSWALLVVGGIACLVGALGVLRMPDFYTRAHAASVCDNVGALLVILGLALQAGWTLVAFKLAVIALLILFSSPVATHALVRAAMHRGLEPELACGEVRSKP